MSENVLTQRGERVSEGVLTQREEGRDEGVWALSPGGPQYPLHDGPAAGAREHLLQRAPERGHQENHHPDDGQQTSSAEMEPGAWPGLE